MALYIIYMYMLYLKIHCKTWLPFGGEIESSVVTACIMECDTETWDPMCTYSRILWRSSRTMREDSDLIEWERTKNEKELKMRKKPITF